MEPHRDEPSPGYSQYNSHNAQNPHRHESNDHTIRAAKKARISRAAGLSHVPCRISSFARSHRGHACPADERRHEYDLASHTMRAGDSDLLPDGARWLTRDSPLGGRAARRRQCAGRAQNPLRLHTTQITRAGRRHGYSIVRLPHAEAGHRAAPSNEGSRHGAKNRLGGR